MKIFFNNQRHKTEFFSGGSENRDFAYKYFTYFNTTSKWLKMLHRKMQHPNKSICSMPK